MATRLQQKYDNSCKESDKTESWAKLTVEEPKNFATFKMKINFYCRRSSQMQ